MSKKNNPADKVEQWPIEKLVPYAKNSRTHSEDQIAQLAASIKEWGFTSAILVDEDGGIIAGHGRVMAARKLGLASLPVMVAAGWSEAQKRAYVIADNKLALNAGWDNELLALELAELDGLGFDVELTGFDAGELDELLALCDATPEGQTDPDAVPEPQAQAITVPGDIWQLGKHRLMCGDSTDAAMVAVLMDGNKADLCLTDPPYGLGDTVSTKNDYAEYDDSKENLIGLVDKFLPLARDLSKSVVLTPGNANHRIYPQPTWTMAWFVPAGTGRGPWGFCCWQPILCYGKDPKLSKGKGSHPDAIVHSESAEKNGHPCPKPINFWKWLMERTSELGELIYEPFSGSGTTLIAAEQTGRRCYAMELSPQYVDVAVRRWQEFTGKQATHAETGKPFAEVMNGDQKAKAES